MLTLALVYPSPALATVIDPLSLALGKIGKNDAGANEVLEVAAGIIFKRLKPFLHMGSNTGSQIDQRWYWAAPALLDARLFPGVRDWCLSTSGWPASRYREEGIGFQEHIKNLVDAFEGRLNPPLGRPPEDLSHVLASLALAAPGICALRSMIRIAGPLRPDNGGLLSAAAHVSEGFRSLFNMPEAIGLLRAIGDETHYWRAVLRYCLDGNIQAVLDEYVHVLQESLGVFEARPAERVSETATAIGKSLLVRPSHVTMDLIHFPKRQGTISIAPYSSRCRFALRLGKTEG